MNVQLTEVQKNLINSIASKEGLNDFELTTNPATTKGDNYVGVITTVSLEDDETKLDLILKAASVNDELRKKIAIRSLFLREMHMYEQILPAFDKFQKDEGLPNRFSAYPKLYGECDEDRNECLIFENLKELGYKLWNRRIPMNSDHIELVLTEYGKFHAISFAMKDKKPEVYLKLTKNLRSIFEDNNVSELDESVKHIFQNGFNALEGNDFATQALERFNVVVTTFLNEGIRVPEDKLTVLHGDCWCNNMLFKYEDPQNSEKPTKLRLIDWQIAATGSPAMDLAYFLILSAPKEILSNFKKYLKIYHASLCKSLTKFSCNPETLFPFTLLEQHWQKYAKFGLYVALMVLKLSLGEADEVPDMTEIAESGRNFADSFNFDSIHNNAYKERITDIVTVLAENGLI